MIKKILTALRIIIIVFAVTVVINIFFNKFIFVRKYKISSEKVTENFNGYKIVQITDVHSIRDEISLEKIINKVKKQKPDIIFVTGDLIDSDYYLEQNNLYESRQIDKSENLTLTFMEELTRICDTYYIYGNHEMMLLDDPENNTFKVNLENLGVKILNNSTEVISLGEEKINLVGIQDPATLYKDEKYAYYGISNLERTKLILDDLMPNVSKENFTILLSHRPEYFETYEKYNIDLALTGHTHGGIMRLPIINGIYAHPQGWLPKYSYGIYQINDFSMIISGGIGYSKLPIRIFNPPEICSITLEKK